MCGLAGFFQPVGFSASTCEGILKQFSERLVHRGPDDGGSWADADAGIAITHRRLSVLDLSPTGHQPMKSRSGRYVIAFNGEIYNHRQIRKDLDALESPPVWNGHSDTETLLSGLERWGIVRTLEKIVGMFAFALWDREERVLTLARDRVGEKPLYCGWQGDTFLFGSELKALRAHPAFQGEIDREVLALYMRYGYIKAPYSIYRNISKLIPGTYLQISAQYLPGTMPQPKVYWSLAEVAGHGADHPFKGSDREAIGELESLLRDAISLQSLADVPLGAFLSGGIDSTTIVALMQDQSSTPVKTFTIGFQESDYNEAGYARTVARHLGTDHTELFVSSFEAMEVIPRLPDLYDEPFGDSSAIPTFLVSQLARQHVTVSLSGDGGDELFGGYGRYERTHDIWSVMQRIPRRVREAFSRGIRACYPHQYSQIGWRANRLALFLAATTANECYQAQVSQRNDVRDIVLNLEEVSSPNEKLESERHRDDIYSEMMYSDTMSYLPDDILAKVDRASMGVSLEARVPMLDHRVLEFAWRLPVRMKVRDGQGKWPLRQILRKFVPNALIDRPKMGFGVPVAHWLRGPLREWAETLLSEESLRQGGFLDHRGVRAQWLRHLAGHAPGGDSLWTVLMFQAWSLQSALPYKSDIRS